MRAAGRACSPMDEPTATVLLGAPASVVRFRGRQAGDALCRVAGGPARAPGGGVRLRAREDQHRRPGSERGRTRLPDAGRAHRLPPVYSHGLSLGLTSAGLECRVVADLARLPALLAESDSTSSSCRSAAPPRCCRCAAPRLSARRRAHRRPGDAADLRRRAARGRHRADPEVLLHARREGDEEQRVGPRCHRSVWTSTAVTSVHRRAPRCRSSGTAPQRHTKRWTVSALSRSARSNSVRSLQNSAGGASRSSSTRTDTSRSRTSRAAVIQGRRCDGGADTPIGSTGGMRAAAAEAAGRARRRSAPSHQERPRPRRCAARASRS